MSRKRASLLTIRSLTALSKVCSSRSSCDSINTLNLLKNLSTYAERLDFQNPNCYNIDNSLQYDQNPSGFYSGQSSLDFQQKSNDPNWGFRESPINDKGKNPVAQDGRFGGLNGQNHGNSQQNTTEYYPECNAGYSESFRGEQQNSRAGQNGNFKVSYGQNDGDSKQKLIGIYGENSNQIFQKHGAVYRESTGNEYGNNTFHQNGNFSGNNWNNNGQLQQNLNGGQAQIYRSEQHNLNGFNGENANVHDYNSQRLSESSGSFNDNCMQNTGQYQQTVNDHYARNFGNYQNSPSIYQQNQNAGQYQQTVNDHYVGNFGNYQNSPSVYQQNQNTGQYQQTVNDHYARNFGNYQNSPSVYQQNQNTRQYQWGQSCGQYQQNHNVAQYQSNSNNINNWMMPSQVVIDTKSEVAEASESSQINGSIQELDAFLTEGKVKEAVEVLGLLDKQCIPVDLPRFLQLMQACGEAKTLEEAKVVHEHIERLLAPLKVSTYNRILKMYSECGSMDGALDVFNNMRDRNLTSWDTMITGLAKNGLGEDAVDLFSQFKQEGLKPDGQMFMGVFSACSVLGDVDEGMLHFESMSKVYGIAPSMKHYVSIVDLLGTTGYLDEALDFIEKMPMEPSVDVWETLMNLCRIHGNLALGDRCAEIVQQLDPSLLDEKSMAGLVVVKASDLAKEKEKKKLASQNLLEVRSWVQEYRAVDTSYPDSDKMNAQIRCLKAHMKEVGYIPERDLC